MGMKCEREFHVPKQNGQGVKRADVAMIYADGKVLALEVKAYQVKADGDQEVRQHEQSRESNRCKQVFTDYGHTEVEAEILSKSGEHPETVVPVLLSSTGQIEPRSRRWLCSLLKACCPAPIRRGKVRDPLWNPNRFLRRIALNATIMSAGRVLSALGRGDRLIAWDKA